MKNKTKKFKNSIDKLMKFCYNKPVRNKDKQFKNKGVKRMNINVVNNVPDIQVNVDKGEKDSLVINITKLNGTLGDVKCGQTVKIGKRKYIVLSHKDGHTAVITEEFAKKMEFGKDGYYPTSDVRKYCNGEFYKELCEAVGKENIIKHPVYLGADDGTGKDEMCDDFVSILTTEQYREFREYLPAYGDWWWTATRVTYTDKDYAHSVCGVSSRGVLNWGGSGCCCGVRPFCILNSSISVSC